MTITELVRGLPTLDQLEVFQRADRLIPIQGRYFGGQLDQFMVDAFTVKEGRIKPDVPRS